MNRRTEIPWTALQFGYQQAGQSRRLSQEALERFAPCDWILAVAGPATPEVTKERLEAELARFPRFNTPEFWEGLADSLATEAVMLAQRELNSRPLHRLLVDARRRL